MIIISFYNLEIKLQGFILHILSKLTDFILKVLNLLAIQFCYYSTTLNGIYYPKVLKFLKLIYSLYFSNFIVC
jgi:hypothetical protein